MEYRLRDLINIKHGFAFKSEFFSVEETNRLIITPGNVKIGGGFNDNKFKYLIEDFEVNPAYIFNDDDIFINMTDLSKNGDTLGLPARIPLNSKKKYLHNQRLGRVTILEKDKVDKNFLFYVLCSRAYRGHILGSATGSTVKHTSPTKILEFKFNFPNLKIQRYIGNILSKLDDKIILNNELINNLEQISQTLFKRWFIDFEFPNEEGQPYKSSGGEMVESELGEIPKGWEVLVLNEILEVIIDHRGKTPKKLKGDWTLTGIPAVSAKNIKNKRLINKDKMKYVDHCMYDKWMKDELKAGDILLTSEAPLGESYYLVEKEKYVLSQRLYALRANKKISSEYLWETINSDYFQNNLINKATGSTVQGIRQSELIKLKVLVPTDNLIRNFTTTVTNNYTQIYSLNIENNKLVQLRDTLLPKLLSGEIEIPEDLEV